MVFNSDSDMTGYSLRSFRRDLLSGVASGALYFPFVLAFAVASGVSPGQGIVTAVAAALLIGALGGSRILISGPLVAFIAFSFSIIQRYGFSTLAAVTALSGATMVLLGVLRIGCLVRFIPRAVIVGLSAGVAITVLADALGPVFGLATGGPNADFMGTVASLVLGLRFVNPWSCALAAATLAVIAIGSRWFGRWMLGSLAALVAGTLAVAFFGIPVETVGFWDGAALLGIPSITIPRFGADDARVLFSSAISLALLASVESLMGAAVAEGMTGERRDPDRVLFAQGIVNLVIPFLGGIPSGGWTSPTVYTVRRGVRSSVAAFAHAFVLLGFSLLLGRLVSYMPVPVLAAVVAFASTELIGLPVIRAIAREGKSDTIVFCVTLILTVFFDLMIAVAFGILLSACFSLRAGSALPTVKEMQGALRARGELRVARESCKTSRDNPTSLSRFSIPKGVAVFELLSPLSFGALQRFGQYALKSGSGYGAFVLRMREAIYVDEAGLRAIGCFAAACRRRGIAFYIADIHTQPYMLAAESGLEDDVGKENFFGNLGEALARAGDYVSSRSLSRREYEQPQ